MMRLSLSSPQAIRSKQSRRLPKHDGRSNRMTHKSNASTIARRGGRARTSQSRKPTISPARTLAQQLLDATLGQGNTLLEALAASGEERYDPRDRALAREIALGTCRTLGRIRFVLDHFAPRWDKFPPAIQRILELSIYQLLYLERVPAYAIINDAVELARANRLGGLAKAVNGILRNIERNRADVCFPKAEDNLLKYLTVSQSHPHWLVERWIQLWGEERCRALCEFNNARAPLSLRARSTGDSETPPDSIVDAAIQKLAEMGKAAKADNRFPARIVLDMGEESEPELARNPAWAAQDGASQLVSLLAAPKPGERIWDVCAAPGGKTLHLADLTRGRCEILATDRSPVRLERLRLSMRERGVSCVRSEVLDVLTPPIHLHDTELYDIALVDAPCSGWGTFRRHPDLRWRLRQSDGHRLGDQASAMLNNVCDWVKPAGTLIYSTCTLSPEENEETITRFLRAHPEFETESARDYVPPAFREAVTSEGWLSIFPSDWELDGVFAARLRKRG